MARSSGAVDLGDVGGTDLAIRAHDDLATATAHDEGGGGIRREDGCVFGAIYRRIQGDVLGDTRSVADLTLQHVAVNAVGGGFDGVLAGTAGVHELAAVLVLLGVQHVGALVAELECDLLGVVLLGALIGRVWWGRHLGWCCVEVCVFVDECMNVYGCVVDGGQKSLVCVVTRRFSLSWVRVVKEKTAFGRAVLGDKDWLCYWVGLGGGKGSRENIVMYSA